MAEVATLTIVLRQRWWVPAYFLALKAFVWTLAWAADEGDLAALIEREADWLARHGYRITLG